MAIPLDFKDVVRFEELLTSQVIQQEALTRLLIEKGILTNKEFWELMKGKDKGINRKKEGGRSCYPPC